MENQNLAEIIVKKDKLYEKEIMNKKLEAARASLKTLISKLEGFHGEAYKIENALNKICPLETPLASPEHAAEPESQIIKINSQISEPDESKESVQL